MEDELESQKQWQLHDKVDLEAKLKVKDKRIEELSAVVASVKSNLQCLICKSLLDVESVVLPCCHHLTCKHCSQRWLRDSGTCPHCRVIIHEEQPICIRQLEPVLRAIDDSQHSSDNTAIELDSA